MQNNYKNIGHFVNNSETFLLNTVFDVANPKTANGFILFFICSYLREPDSRFEEFVADR